MKISVFQMIILLWLGAVLAIVFIYTKSQSALKGLPMVNKYKPVNNSKSNNQKYNSVKLTKPESSMLIKDTSIQQTIGNVKASEKDKGNPLVFLSEEAFISYFQDEFSREELMLSFEKVSAQRKIDGRNNSLEVNKINSNKLGKFDDQYRLKVRFSVKPVPQ